MSKNMNVPKLRFSEFGGDWEEKKLGDIAIKIGSGNTPLGGEKVYTEEGILFIRSQNVNNDKLELLDKTFIPSDIHNKMKGSKVFPKDVLLNITGASIGRSCVVPDGIVEANVNQHVCIVRGDKTLNSNFLQTFISSFKGQKLISQGQTGSGREGLNFQSIASFKLYLPDIKEQEKIASFLSSIDTKIEQLTKKESLLQEYKKGVMQKIFNQEIRFKADDGSGFCDWEEKKIGELFKFKQGVQCGVENQHFEQNDERIRFIRIIDITQNDEPIRFINDPGREHHIIEDDLFMVRYGAAGLIGYGYAGVIANNLFRFLPILVDITCNKYYYFLFNFMKQKFEQLAGSSTMPALNFKSLNTLSISQPSIKEQTKIANFLSSIDKKIENTKKELEKTKEFKKALLQQMFV